MEFFSFSEKTHPFLFLSMFLKISCFFDNNGISLSQLKLAAVFKIGLSPDKSNTTPLDAFKMPTDLHKTSSHSSSISKTELIATLISNSVSNSKSFRFISVFFASTSSIN